MTLSTARPQLADFVAESSSRRPIVFKPESRRQMVQVMEARRRWIEGGAADGLIDRVALQLGASIAVRLEAGTMTREDVGIVWYTIHDEILQMELAGGYVVEEVRGAHPGRWRTRVEEIALAAPLNLGRAGMFQGWARGTIHYRLTAYNDMRLDLEHAIFASDTDDPDALQPASIHPARFGAGGNLLHRHVSVALASICQWRHGGRSVGELWARGEHQAALLALHGANEQAVQTFAPHTVRSVLSLAEPYRPGARALGA